VAIFSVGLPMEELTVAEGPDLLTLTVSATGSVAHLLALSVGALILAVAGHIWAGSQSMLRRRNKVKDVQDQDRGRIALGAEHPHQALWRDLDRLGERRKSDGRVT
jgi:hypothetical protein